MFRRIVGVAVASVIVVVVSVFVIEAPVVVVVDSVVIVVDSVVIVVAVEAGEILTVLPTSSGSKTWKTMTWKNLAHVYAKLGGRRTCFIEACIGGMALQSLW